MVDILHRIGVVSSPAEVFAALTEPERLAAWWTTNTQGDGGVGGVLQFRFAPGGFDMKVLEAEPAKRVVWAVVDGPEEWVGTTIEWELAQEGEWTIVLFRHLGWREPVEFMYHCNTKWATFLMSLKSLVETGTGAPDPHDVQISNWH